MSNQETLMYVTHAAKSLYDNVMLVECQRLKNHNTDQYRVTMTSGAVLVFKLERKSNWTEESVLEVLTLIKESNDDATD